MSQSLWTTTIHNEIINSRTKGSTDRMVSALQPLLLRVLIRMPTRTPSYFRDYLPAM